MEDQVAGLNIQAWISSLSSTVVKSSRYVMLFQFRGINPQTHGGN